MHPFTTIILAELRQHELRGDAARARLAASVSDRRRATSPVVGYSVLHAGGGAPHRNHAANHG